MSDPFCPRHGRRSRPVETLGLRCDCLEILLAATAPLKQGKWVSAALGPERDGHVRVVGEPEVRAVQQRGDEAVAEALLAGYELGLRGGVPADRVQACDRCGKAFLDLSHRDDPFGPVKLMTCLACYAEENP